MKTETKCYVAVLFAVAALCASAETVALSGKGARLVLDGGGRGVVSLKTPGGIELAATDKPPQRLFTLAVSQQAEPPGKQITVGNWDARVQCETVRIRRDADLHRFSERRERVVCTVSADPDGLDLHWRIKVVMRDGWVLEDVRYPQITLAAPRRVGR